MSFWYELGFDQVSRMPKRAIEIYLQRIPALKAETKLMLADAYNAVWMDKNNKRSTMRKWEQEAFGEILPAKKATKGDMTRMGIGVRTV